MENLFLEKLLNHYQLDKKSYLELTKKVSKKTFCLENHFDKEEEAKAFLLEAISKKKKIKVFGDYDADGIMGVSIFVKTMKMLDFDVDYFIPSRYKEGYGLTENKAQEIVDQKYDIVITIDNGISNNKVIKFLKDNGVSTLIIDHHKQEGELPEADFIIHPIISHFGDVETSAAFTTFMFSRVLLNKFDKYLSTLAAISVISDMMPLKKYNRDLLRIVFEEYIPHEFPSISNFIDDNKLDENNIGSIISPSINSLGRMLEDEVLDKVVTYFVEGDKISNKEYFDFIINNNKERKALSNKIKETFRYYTFDEPSIVIVSDMKEGLMGIIANSLCSTYHKPVAIILKNKNSNICRGSARGPEGFNVFDAFLKLNDLLINAGGHSGAGGFQIEEKNIEEFKRRFNDLSKNYVYSSIDEDIIPINVYEINWENYHIIHSLSPFGEGLKPPKFLLKGIKSNALSYAKDNKTIMHRLYNSQNTKLLGFNMPREDILKYANVNFYGFYRENNFKGISFLEFFITKFEESK